jgi:hypothetical protein
MLNLILAILIVVVVGISLISWTVHDLKKARRQADEIIAGKRCCPASEVNDCILDMGFGVDRWCFEQDRYRVERLREIREKRLQIAREFVETIRLERESLETIRLEEDGVKV